MRIYVGERREMIHVLAVQRRRQRAAVLQRQHQSNDRPISVELGRGEERESRLAICRFKGMTVKSG